MKKPYNAFKATRLSNMMRILAAVCIFAVVVALILFVSIAENRREIASWLGIKGTEQADQQASENSGENVGLTQPASVNTNIQVRAIGREDHLWGPIDAPVNVIVYDDFECPFCAQLYETINRAKAEFGNDLVVAVRHFPLMSHEQAIPAAQAAECAGEQSKFWEMYHALFEDNKTGNLSAEAFTKNATEIGLDMEVFSSCLTKTSYTDKILAQKEEIKNLGVIGTPASFINTQYVPGAVPYEDFTYPDGTAALGMRSLIQKKLNEQSAQ